MNLFFDSYFQNRLNITFTIDTSPAFTSYAREVLDTKRPVVVVDEPIKGTYQISLLNDNKTVSHNGIRLAVVGEFRSYNNEVYGQFFCRYISIAPPGVITQTINGSFNFDDANLPTDTYYGKTLQAIYAVQIQIKKLTSFAVVRELQFYVLGFDVKNPIKVSRNVIGISNLLRFEVYLPNEQVEINSALIGQIYFVYVKMKIISLKLQIINQEYYEDEKIRIRNETVLCNFEVLDGSPARGTRVPFRIFLKSFNLSRFLNFSGSQLLSRIVAKVIVVDSDGQEYSKLLHVSFVLTEPENIEESEKDLTEGKHILDNKREDRHETAPLISPKNEDTEEAASPSTE